MNVRMPPSSIEEQMRSGIVHGRERGIQEFLAYFQPFSNTYDRTDRLAQRYDIIRRFPEVVGLSIGTRPDCIDREKLALIDSYTPTHMVWIEYGLQSIHDKTLTGINRGHDSKSFLDAVTLTNLFPRILICVHIILGLPGETAEDMMHTAQALAHLPIHGIKLHPLHVVKDTPLAASVKQGTCPLLTLDQYVSLVCDFLELTPPTITVQRITADAPQELLVGPDWVSRKMATLNAIDREFKRRGTRQGARHSSF